MSNISKSIASSVLRHGTDQSFTVNFWARYAGNLNTYLGNDKYGWGYIGNRGAWHNKHKLKTYGKDFRTGDVVRATLDMDAGKR